MRAERRVIHCRISGQLDMLHLVQHRGGHTARLLKTRQSARDVIQRQCALLRQKRRQRGVTKLALLLDQAGLVAFQTNPFALSGDLHLLLLQRE
jgi:hypothetical protein